MLIKDILKAKDKILVIYKNDDEKTTHFIPVNNILMMFSELDEETETVDYYLLIKGKDFPIPLNEKEMEELEIL